MDLDNIKDLWQKAAVATPEISLEKQKEIRMPLEKIRKNMRMEFWMSIGILPIFFVYFIVVKDFNRLFFLSIAFVSFLAIITYYFLKFFRLYKKINTQEFKTYHNLLNLRYELILNTELYKSYYIASVIILMSFFLTIYVGKTGYASLLMFSVSLFFGILTMIVIGRIWLKEMYGKYIVQISDLMDQLSGEKSDFVFNRSALTANNSYVFVEKTRLFFENRFGKKGKTLNTFFWILVGFLLLLLFSYTVGYGIGYLAAKLNIIDAETIKNLR